MHPQRHLSLCHISQPHLVTCRNQSRRPAPVHIPPRACPPLGDTHLPSRSEPRDLGPGATEGHTPGLGTASHTRHVGPACPSRRLGALGRRSRGAAPPQVSHFQGPRWGRSSWPGGRSRLPPLRQLSGLPGRPFQTPPSGAVWTWEGHSGLHPGRLPGTLLASDSQPPSCGSHRFHPVLHPNGWHGHQGGCLGTTPPTHGVKSLSRWAWVCL